VIESCGHTVRRIHPRFVKPYFVADKNDANDAAAICEAVQRQHMRFVPRKSQAQADIQSLHRVRQGFIQSRTTTINQVRGLLAKNGIVFRQGANAVRNLLPVVIDDPNNQVSGVMRQLIRSLYDTIVFLDAKIAEQDVALKEIVKANEICQRLMRGPGVGIIAATILLAEAGAINVFKNGHQFAAYMGLVPRQHSTGGKQRMLGISKRGDSYVLTLLIPEARSVLRSVAMGGSPFRNERWTGWLNELSERRGMNKASVALANKTAWVVWNMMARGTEYGAAA
jgi:transposase